MAESTRVGAPESPRRQQRCFHGREVWVRRSVAAGIVALAVGSVIVAVLHVVGPGAGISPIRRTISEYGLTSLGWAFGVAVVAVAAGSAAVLLAVGLARSGHAHAPGGRVGLVLGACWVLGLVTVVAFPKTNWAVGPSLSGQIHRAAGLIAFLALPVAVLVLLRPYLSRGRAGSHLARAGVGLALAALAWFVPIVVAITTGAHGGAWWVAVPLGLLERGMAVTEIAALVVLGRWAIRAVGAAAPRAPAVTDPAAP